MTICPYFDAAVQWLDERIESHLVGFWIGINVRVDNGDIALGEFEMDPSPADESN